MASGGKESSPYVGVQKPKSGGYAVEKRHFLYEGEDFGKFFHRTNDERKAAFTWDVVNYVGRTNSSTFNFANGRKVLEEHGPRLRQELEESLAKCNWRAMAPKERKEKVRDCLIHEAKKLWNEYEGEILKDHIRPLHKGSSNIAVEQLNHGHEDSVQKQDHIRPLHKGSSNNALEQLNHGHEDYLAGECSMTKQIVEHVYKNGGLPKFDVDVGLRHQPPHEEPALKKKLPLPPSLEMDPQDSCSQTQEDPNEGIDASGRKTEQNLEKRKSEMEIRCDGYKKWLEISDNLLKSECSQAKVSILLDQTAPARKVLQSICAQMQCAEYEKIFDAINDVIDSECISKEILDKYRAETEPILEQCRANWHS